MTTLIIKQGTTQHRLGRAALLVGALLLLLAGTQVDIFYQGQFTLVLIYAIAISGLNLVTGYTGLISVGHSAFFGLGAYATGVLVVKYNQDPISTIPLAMFICFLLGAVVGLPSLRIRGLYLATVTLALGIAFPELISQFENLTGGASGMQIPRRLLSPPPWSGLELGQKGLWLYLVSAVALVLVLLGIHNLVTSRFGLAMKAVRDHEIAAASSGINVAAVKIVAFGLSGAVTGLAGCLFAMYLGSLTPSGSFSLLQAIVLITGLVIGGQGTRLGPVVGGFAVVYLPYWASDLGVGQLAPVIFGLVLIAIVFLMPEGIVGGVARLLQPHVVLEPAAPTPPSPGRRARPTPEPDHAISGTQHDHARTPKEGSL